VRRRRLAASGHLRRPDPPDPDKQRAADRRGVEPENQDEHDLELFQHRHAFLVVRKRGYGWHLGLSLGRDPDHRWSGLGRRGHGLDADNRHDWRRRRYRHKLHPVGQRRRRALVS